MYLSIDTTQVIWLYLHILRYLLKHSLWFGIGGLVTGGSPWRGETLTLIGGHSEPRVKSNGQSKPFRFWNFQKFVNRTLGERLGGPPRNEKINMSHLVRQSSGKGLKYNLACNNLVLCIIASQWRNWETKKQETESDTTSVPKVDGNDVQRWTSKVNWTTFILYLMWCHRQSDKLPILLVTYFTIPCKSVWMTSNHVLAWSRLSEKQEWTGMHQLVVDYITIVTLEL